MDIDDVLVSAGMGRYQITKCILFGLVLMFSNISPVTYVFTAGDLKYRCQVPGCEDTSGNTKLTYNPEWLQYSTPFREETGHPYKCERYGKAMVYDNGTKSDQCLPRDFNQTIIETCRNGDWVFEDHEITIGTEFGLMCEDNKWKLSMVGTVNNFGQFVGIPLSGMIADKFGRKFGMIFGAVSSAILSIIQSLSVSYTMFLVLELLSSIVSSGVYTITFVLAMELVLPKQRVVFYSLLETFYPFGGMLVAFIASQVKDWRLLLQISNVPGLLFLLYFWLTEESMRWLEMQGKKDKVIKILHNIAKTNKKHLPDLSNMQLESTSYLTDGDGVKSKASILRDIIRSPMIFLRTIRCSLVWIGITLVYYGLSINATDIAGDKYINFMLVTFVEVPSCLLNWFIMEELSRKSSLVTMCLLSGVTSVCYNLTPPDYMWVKLSMFMISKLAISVAFCIVYMLTVEIFPTRMRATLLAVCSMMGRVGSMLAPQTTLLAVYFGEYVTMLVFGVTAFLVAAITMTLPESKNIKLPNTVDQAEQIGHFLRRDSKTDNE
ncbi:solute carrier family 22 member 4-like [Adelges cooleyi]|uniref:solute carrier family 22 member 4-like n=1 Tax=Adelges cooleyi TaxID=133065 RepID=UPI0021804DF1|nr:solute carrier family 22 member 4-like [Adelges cooleyi]